MPGPARASGQASPRAAFAERPTFRPRRWRAACPVLALGFGLSAGASAAQAAPDCAGSRSRVETLICADPALTRLDDELRRLFDRISGETRGIDGETGRAIDTFGADHARWRTRIRDACPDAACLTRVYTARIAQVQRDWSEALSDTPALRHVVNARFGFSIDVPADLVAEPPPDNGDGQAFHSADGHLHLTVSGLNDGLDQDLDAVVAADRKTCLRQPPEYGARKPGWIVFSCTTADGILYRKTLRAGGRGGAFVTLRIRYPVAERARRQAAVTTAATSLRLTEPGRDSR
ncbi:hypothetical protein MCBMB27_03779 [Methylobacterium phyllosphaerae]|uniref:Lysozyme inhibitor LprI N-terminal domain-containing protein n=1 Tax=Methylobacterium phyllosphaerae TaxID=418223 RepID=A0AAE8L971_9HYPH|nr:hypothetical protein [Methylobacterium phyllosphaerae]APT33070.1 hypothetical protein MCBMB27_03779 [Methylobacterium phyllosphaerae]SFH57501.1 hypothetical protein SAMN05192567_13323 [Methylobacterium phyllosphaerae]